MGRTIPGGPGRIRENTFNAIRGHPESIIQNYLTGPQGPSSDFKTGFYTGKPPQTPRPGTGGKRTHRKKHKKNTRKHNKKRSKMTHKKRRR